MSIFYAKYVITIQIVEMIEKMKKVYTRTIENSDWLSMYTVNAAKEKVITEHLILC